VGPYAGASPGARAPRALRIALASRLPPSPLSRLHEDNRAALAETVVLLRRLGHEVNECELDYGPLMPPPEFTMRFLRSRHEDALALAHPERLERRMRAIARLGGLITPGMVAWARGREAAYAARLNEPLRDHDVLLMPVTPAPPPRIGACEGRGWLSTTLIAGGTVSYMLSWNLTGQPACSVPAGFAPDGLPRAVQLVGRPNDEATLCSLAAQLEVERPWAQSRPAGFS
jgi:amidase